jgi:hypothetical protein
VAGLAHGAQAAGRICRGDSPKRGSLHVHILCDAQDRRVRRLGLSESLLVARALPTRFGSAARGWMTYRPRASQGPPQSKNRRFDRICRIYRIGTFAVLFSRWGWRQAGSVLVRPCLNPVHPVKIPCSALPGIRAFSGWLWRQRDTQVSNDAGFAKFARIRVFRLTL